ncbi:hypothetical protein AN1V17_02150 [Vallitalea sediminicola]
MSLKYYKVISGILASYFLGFFIFSKAYANSSYFPILLGSCVFTATMFETNLNRIKSFYKIFLLSSILISIGIYLVEHTH